jgi:hypothetical protein
MAGLFNVCSAPDLPMVIDLFEVCGHQLRGQFTHQAVRLEVAEIILLLFAVATYSSKTQAGNDRKLRRHLIDVHELIWELVAHIQGTGAIQQSNDSQLGMLLSSFAHGCPSWNSIPC